MALYKNKWANLMSPGFAVIAMIAIIFGSTLATIAPAQSRTLTKGAMYLTSGDWELIDQASARLSRNENSRIGTVEIWSNVKTGNSGSVTLIMLGERKGMSCRRIQYDIKVKKSSDPFSYTLDTCKTADGTWRVF